MPLPLGEAGAQATGEGAPRAYSGRTGIYESGIQADFGITCEPPSIPPANCSRTLRRRSAE